MNGFTIEQAFEVRQQILASTDRYSPLRSVVHNMLSGVYDNCDEEPILLAENDLAFLVGLDEKEVIPVKGQVWKVKPEKSRSWRDGILTIDRVNVDTEDCKGLRNDYFTYEEQENPSSCWAFWLLENYTLVTGA